MGFLSGVDKGEISIISSKKIDPVKLVRDGDSEKSDTPEALARANLVKKKLNVPDEDPNAIVPVAPVVTDGNPVDVPLVFRPFMPAKNTEKCTLCCMAFGAMLAAPACLIISIAHTSVSVFIEKKVSYTVNSIFRQIGWMAAPGVLVSCTFHWHLNEAMYSGRRNSWGVAWWKAIVANTLMWTTGAAIGTAAWRLAFPKFAWGKRMCKRYPIPLHPLETRLIITPNQYIQGMGATYWLLATVVGNTGLGVIGALAWYNDRVHYVMSPSGPYGRACAPFALRKDIARDAHVAFDEKPFKQVKPAA